MPESSRRELVAIGAAYAITVVLLAIGSMLRPRMLWGWSAYSYLPSPWEWAAVGVAIVWGAAAYWMGGRVAGGASGSRSTLSGKVPRGWGVTHIVGMGVLFVVLRAQAHFLGDGYTLLGTYASANPIIKSRALGEAMLHLWVRDWLGGATAEAALLSFRVLAVLAGVIYLGVVWWSATRLFGRTKERVLFAVGMATPGYMLLYFGYVELYAFFVTAVVAFGLAGLLASEGKATRWLVLPPLLAAVGLHVMGVLLIPAAVYVLMSGTRAGQVIGRIPVGAKISALAAAGALGGAGFWYLSSHSYFFKLSFLTPTANRFTVEGYTLFSGWHLLDMGNLALVLFPGLLVALAPVVSMVLRGDVKRRPLWFLGLLVLATWGAAFVFDPKLGMPRDWDLFAFAGAAPALLISYLLSRRLQDRGEGALVLVLVIGLNLIVLGGRVILQTQPLLSAEQFRQHIRWDRLKHQTTWTTLPMFYARQGDSTRAEAEFEAWMEVYPGYGRNRAGLALLQAGKPGEALAVFREVIADNPSFPPGYGNAGVAFLALGEADSAREYLQIAEGMNPYNPHVLTSRGQLLWRENERERAAELWRRALAIDPTQYRAALGLMDYSREKRDQESYFRYLALAVAHSDAPAPRLAELGAYYLTVGREEEGTAFLREATAKGLDSSSIRQLRERYPEIGF